MVRRLKSELNQGLKKSRFATRFVKGLDIQLEEEEKCLYTLLKEYRDEARTVIGKLGRQERHIGEFLFMLLTKRLLSSSYAFACTWWQHVAGLDISTPEIEEVDHARKRAEASLNDDEERTLREEDVARKTGAWLNKFANKAFPPDAKWKVLLHWIEDNLKSNKQLTTDERLIIFTEYKDTLNYLSKRFNKEAINFPQLDIMFGGISNDRRELVKQAFNDPGSNIRILLATDSAAEGINLQTSCRYIIHQDIPWNPMRLEQRNGRVDRHGQFRDVYIHHFTSEDEADLRFLSRVVTKVEQAREDLGSIGQVLDQAIISHFAGNDTDLGQLELWVENSLDSNFSRDDMNHVDRGSDADYNRAMQRLRATELSLGITEQNMAGLLRTAVSLEKGNLEAVDEDIFRLQKIPSSWSKLVKETLTGNEKGSLPKLVFDASYFEEEKNGRKIYMPKVDTTLLRLGHPVMQRALFTLKRSLWSDNRIQRWTVQKANLPSSFETLLVMYLLLDVTNRMREPIHQEIIPIPFNAEEQIPVGLESEFWQQVSALPRTMLSSSELSELSSNLSDYWVDHELFLAEYVCRLKSQLEEKYATNLAARLDSEITTEKQNFDRRIAELQRDRQTRFQQKLRKDIEKQRHKLTQLVFYADVEAGEKQKLRDLELQLELINENSLYMQDALKSEKQRVIEDVLPKRYSLGHLALYPLGIEYIVRSKKGGI